MKEIFAGRDGKPSGRKIIGFSLILWGAILLSINVAQAMPEEVSTAMLVWKLGPGSVLVGVGAYFWGLITAQNIKDIVGKKKE